MLDSIEISNFKAIGDGPFNPLVLKDLKSVNYLVGPNGCGKSSALEYLFQKDLSQTRQSFKMTKESINFQTIFSFRLEHLIELEKISKLRDCIKDKWIDFEVSHQKMEEYNDKNSNNSDNLARNLEEYFSILAKERKESFDIESRNLDIFNKVSTLIKDRLFGSINPANLKKQFFTYNTYQKENIINEATLINFGEIKMDKESGFNEEEKISYIKFFNKYYFQTNPIKDINKRIPDDLIQVVHRNDRTVFLKDFASGYQNLFSFYQILKKKLIEGKDLFNIFLVEEPENGLHPSFQKLLPEIFADLSKEYFVSFLISTHSPFIISAAAKEKNQKVYLIEGGQTKDAENGKLNTEKSKIGYSGGECLLAVNEMLGSNINDIAPHTIIFCERTLKILLEKIFEKSDSKPAKPIILTDKSGGSDDRICEGAELWKTIFLNTKKAIETNLLNYNIFGVIDECNNAENWKISLGEKLIIINSTELENLYDKDLVNQFLKDTKICQSEWKGADSSHFSEFIKENALNKSEIKKSLAESIGNKVDKEFVKNISQDLHTLIFT